MQRVIAENKDIEILTAESLFSKEVRLLSSVIYTYIYIVFLKHLLELYYESTCVCKRVWKNTCLNEKKSKFTIVGIIYIDIDFF